MNNLLITRFTHGSAGKFFSTVLQTSLYVDHWNPIIQEEKQGKFHTDLTLEYVRRSFPADHNTHLANEPMVPYPTHLYSTGYPRGNDVTSDQYFSEANARLDKCLLDNLLANIVFHKPNIPEFCRGSKTVTILTRTAQELTWLHKTLWSKQFIEQDDQIIYSPASPEHCSFSSLKTILEYQPEFRFALNEKQILMDKYVVNDHTAPWYKDPNCFKEHDLALELNNYFVDLRNFFDTNTFINMAQETFAYFDLGALDVPLVSEMHKIWWSRQHAE